MEALVKRWWHRDLVSDAATHAWVLNLYRAGERHPETVTDYFPVALAPFPWLAEALTRHRDDERRHGQMLARAIARMGERVDDDVAHEDVFNHVIRRCTGRDFSCDTGAPEGERRETLAHFLAHAHHLERRVATSLGYHLDACQAARSEVAAVVIARIRDDELRHLGYTRGAVYELVPKARGDALMELHRDAEARANLLFSQRQVRRFLRDFPDAATASRRGLYRFCAWLQETSARHA